LVASAILGYHSANIAVFWHVTLCSLAAFWRRCRSVYLPQYRILWL